MYKRQLLDQPAHVLLGDRRVHDVPPRRHADLALVEEGREGARRRGRLQRGVVEHDQRVVAAQFQRDPLQGAPRHGPHLPADGGGAGERHHRHRRVGRQRAARDRVARQHVQDTLREPRLLEQPRYDIAAGNRGTDIRFEEHGVAQGECRGHRTQGEQQRYVPRADHPDHAERHPAGRARPVRPAGQDLAVRLGRQRRRLQQLLHRVRDLGLRLRPYRTALADQPPDDLRAVFLQHGRRAPQDGRAGGGGQGAPRRLCPCRAGRRTRDVRRVGDTGPGERLPGRRLDHLDDGIAAVSYTHL